MRGRILWLTTAWYSDKAAKSKKQYNPPYVPQVVIPDSVARFCKDKTAADVLAEFDLARIKNSSIVVYPFTGFELARCLELAYEKK